jgi:hypothetical protein
MSNRRKRLDRRGSDPATGSETAVVREVTMEEAHIRTRFRQ